MPINILLTCISLAVMFWIVSVITGPAQSADCQMSLEVTIKEEYEKQATYEEVRREFKLLESSNPDVLVDDLKRGYFIVGCRVRNDLSMQKLKTFTVTSESRGKSWRYELSEVRPKL